MNKFLLLTLAGVAAAILPMSAFAAGNRAMHVISDAKLLKETGIQILKEDPVTGVALAKVTPEEQAKIAVKAHEWGRCGGFEALTTKGESVQTTFGALRQLHQKNLALQARKLNFRRALDKNSRIVAAVGDVNENNLKDLVSWLSAFPTRYNKAKTANDHVVALKERLEKMVAGTDYPISVDLVNHNSTPQKTVRVRIEGKSRPNEIVVMGAHLDSISSSWGSRDTAPGADDNASGSSNLIEALRILVRQPQPERSVEIFWYAGEESGLLGSGEIAKTYKGQQKDVVGVLQLDMTLHPGDGEFVLGSMTDFTSAWLREYFKGLNELYIGAKVVDDRCGYGCSDHASWHRQGYPALMPFEATFRRSNPEIHSKDDVINAKSNFRHSAMFSKIAVAYAMDLSNSTLRSP